MCQTNKSKLLEPHHLVGLRQSPSNRGLEPESIMVSEPESKSYGREPESMMQEPESLVVL